MATLRVVSTLARELEGRSFALGPEGTSLGRDGANRVVIPEASVSRRHARIEVAGTSYHLVDQRSANGTFVNGEPVTMHRLSDGDTVRIGRTTFVFEAAGGTAAVPGPAGAAAQRLRCEACGAVAPAGSRFCAACGQPLPAAAGSTAPTPRPASRAPTAPEIPLVRGEIGAGGAGDERFDEAAPSPSGGAGHDARPGSSDPTAPPSRPSWPPASVPVATTAGGTVAGPGTGLAGGSRSAAAQPRSRRAWAVGCALIALLLLATAAAGLYLLHREGRIDLPGLPDAQAAPE